MAKLTIEMKVKIAWWFIYGYLPLIIFLSEFIVTHIDIEHEPNFDKIEYWLSKAVNIEVYDRD